ncbi:MAG: ATP-binding protein [Eubacteriales bacterium]|jgi:two-component system sensor histidine kinase VicK
MLKTLRVRMVLILTLLIVSVMLLVGTFFLSSVSNFYHEDFQKQIGVVLGAGELSAAVADVQPGEESESHQVYERISAFSGQLGIDTYRNLYLLDGRTGAYLEGTSPQQGATLERTPNLILALTGQVGQQVNRTAAYLDYALPLSTSSGGSYILYIKDSKQELQEMLWMLFAIIMQALMLGLGIAVAMSFFLAKAITNPIENLTKGAKLVASGEFSHTLPVASRDEIGTLTQTFNQMAGVLKDTMEEIEEEKNKLSTIFLYLTDGVIAFTREGRLIHINTAAREMLGLSEEDSFSFANLFSDYYIDVDFMSVLQLQPGENLSREAEIGGKTLRMCFAHFDVDSGEDSGTLGGGVIVVLQDITEQRKFEDSRKEFVANVSHELRTPLTSVKSYTETVRENPDLPDEMRDKFLGVVLYETDRMTRLVKDLLILSRLDSKKMEWVFADFDLSVLLESIYDSTLMDARNHNHTLTLDKPEDLGTICGDKDRVEQVIINVVSNAIKYTPDGGTITITAKGDSEGVEIAVQDTGIGIPAEDIPRLFERFYRVDKARSREKGGTGLGLAIAKEIVYAHNGTIGVESQQDVGTRVIIHLPRRQTAVPRPMEEQKQ